MERPPARALLEPGPPRRVDKLSSSRTTSGLPALTSKTKGAIAPRSRGASSSSCADPSPRSASATRAATSGSRSGGRASSRTRGGPRAHLGEGEERTSGAGRRPRRRRFLRAGGPSPGPRAGTGKRRSEASSAHCRSSRRFVSGCSPGLGRRRAAGRGESGCDPAPRAGRDRRRLREAVPYEPPERGEGLAGSTCSARSGPRRRGCAAGRSRARFALRVSARSSSIAWRSAPEGGRPRIEAARAEVPAPARARRAEPRSRAGSCPRRRGPTRRRGAEAPWLARPRGPRQRAGFRARPRARRAIPGAEAGAGVLPAEVKSRSVAPSTRWPRQSSRSETRPRRSGNDRRGPSRGASRRPPRARGGRWAGTARARPARGRGGRG